MSKSRKLFVLLTVVFAVAVSCVPFAANAATKKPAAKPAAAPKITVPAGPNVLKVVAGRPFETVPSTGKPNILITMCAEESEPGTFTVRHTKSLENVKVVMAGNLVGSSGTILSKYVRISRLEGDEIISAPYGTPLVTNVGPEPTQYWFDVTVPAKTNPGTYKGAIGFYYQNKPLDFVPFEVKVQPMRLIGSSKQYILYTTHCQSDMDEETYDSFLTAFRNCQFKSIAVSACPDDVSGILDKYKTLGLNGPVPMVGYAFNPEVPSIEQIQAINNAKKAAGINNMFFFTVDNPIDEEQISKSIEQIYAIHGARAQAAARVSCEQALEQLEQHLDAINYHVDMPYIQSLIDGTAKKTSMKTDWYWWDARKSVKDNRLYTGIIAWKAGLFGCMPAWMPEEGKTPTDGITSLLTVAMREGIDDTRYMTSFMKALRELKDLKRQKDKAYIEAAEAYLTSFMSKPLHQVTPTQLAEMRSKLTAYSIGLTSRL